MIGERTIGVHPTGDDLEHGVRDNDVDALERGDHGLVRGGEGLGIGHEPDVAATARARLVQEPPHHRERALGTRGDRRPRGIVGVQPAP